MDPRSSSKGVIPQTEEQIPHPKQSKESEKGDPGAQEKLVGGLESSKPSETLDDEKNGKNVHPTNEDSTSTDAYYNRPNSDDEKSDSVYAPPANDKPAFLPSNAREKCRSAVLKMGNIFSALEEWCDSETMDNATKLDITGQLKAQIAILEGPDAVQEGDMASSLKVGQPPPSILQGPDAVQEGGTASLLKLGQPRRINMAELNLPNSTRTNKRLRGSDNEDDSDGENDPTTDDDTDDSDYRPSDGSSDE